MIIDIDIGRQYNMSHPKEEESNRCLSRTTRPKVKKILVPYDGSEMTDRALKYAIYFSKSCKAELLILNIIDQPVNMIPASAIVFSSPRDNLDRINNTLQRISKVHSNQVLEKAKEITEQEGVINASYIMRSGKPVDEIFVVSEERNIDLIVMASSRIASAIRILGSTAKGVLNSIRKPVVIIHE
jgi:nucleotide-binding universal stress UspA family protein